MLPRRLRGLPTHELDNGAVVIEASTPWSRLLGLAGLDLGDLPLGHGLLLRPCRSVHTFGMRFELDLLFLAADGRIALLESGVPPGRIRGSWAGAAVLEYPCRVESLGFLDPRVNYAELLSRLSPPVVPA
jgi:uncharacterized protein